RFDDKKLFEAWSKENEDRVFFQEGIPFTSGLKPLGVHRQVWRKATNSVEFVCFRPKISSDSIVALVKARNVARSQYPQEFGSLPIHLRLVVPDGAVSSFSGVNTEDVVVEGFPG